MTFSWITLTKLWTGLWITQKPIYRAEMVVILILAYLGVTKFSLSRLFARLRE
jgi:hypothetical protein